MNHLETAGETSMQSLRLITCRLLAMLQEREARGEEWVPRWFQATPNAPVYDLEFSAVECPLWEFTGDALKRPPAGPPTGVSSLSWAVK